MFFWNNSGMNRNLKPEVVEGEIGLVINYVPGVAYASDVLEGALELIRSLDGLDRALLSSIDTHLEPVSILNDVQHSSLKLLLARALKSIPDDELGNLNWKKWVGGLLVKGKYELLKRIDQPSTISDTLRELDYSSAPAELVGYEPPSAKTIENALIKVSKARAIFSGHDVTIQTEYGDISLPNIADKDPDEMSTTENVIEKSGTGFFVVKSPDLIGNAQWTLIFSGKTIRARIYHLDWVDSYHRREFAILPGDSLKCKYKEIIRTNEAGAELERTIEILDVLDVISPPETQNFSDL